MEWLEYAALNENLCHMVLPNGLNIYVVPRPEYGKQFAFFAAHYGGMNLRFRGEDANWIDTPAGVAHFLEHKMFDSEDDSAIRIMAANGAVDNAFTSASMTAYYFECTYGFDDNLRNLLSFVSTPYFTKESVEKEQGIIGQEISMSEDEPETAVYYQLLRCLYANHPLQINVLGTTESIAGITPEILHQCHSAFYRPGNMVLCVAGNVDVERIAAIAKSVLPETRTFAAVADLGDPEPADAVKHYAECAMEVSVPIFEIGFKGNPALAGQSLRQRLIAELLCDVLFGPSAPLYSQLYEDGLINGTFDSLYDSVPGCAYLMAGGESREPRKVFDAVLKEANRLVESGIAPELWDRLKRAAYGSMVKRLNSLEDICIELADAHFDGDDYLKFPELFQSIEWSDVKAMLRQWCTESRAALSVVLPVDEA